LRLARAQFASPGVLDALGRLAALGAADPDCAAGAAWLEAELAAMPAARIERRNAAIRALRAEFFPGSANQAAVAIVRSLALYATRRRRGGPAGGDRLDTLRCAAWEAAGGRILSARTIRMILAKQNTL
jgi:hypothetical protein